MFVWDIKLKVEIKVDVMFLHIVSASRPASMSLIKDLSKFLPNWQVWACWSCWSDKTRYFAAANICEATQAILCNSQQRKGLWKARTVADRWRLQSEYTWARHQKCCPEKRQQVLGDSQSQLLDMLRSCIHGTPGSFFPLSSSFSPLSPLQLQNSALYRFWRSNSTIDSLQYATNTVSNYAEAHIWRLSLLR